MEGRRPNDSATDFINDKNPGLSFARRRATTGFTIVELLVVVVVIAVLAAITIVAYNGITNQAKDSALKSDLSTTAKKVGLAHAETGTYPSSAPDGTPGTVQYSGGGNSYCATASGNGRAFRVTQDGNIQSGTCSGHSPVAGTMQSFTQTKCSALVSYDGSNESAVIGLTDSRGGITRTYQVAKLADGKCWMLNNLKLGSTTSSITLTPADSNVASNFTLPQLYSGTSSTYRSNDIPYTYGPVPGDTDLGTTNYGYLYNFPAATAGETRTTLSTGNAPHSICPANWHLPTGDFPSAEFGQLDVGFGGTGMYASGGPSVAKWQPTGPFRGSFSGYWYGGFDDQGDAGVLWSASAVPDVPLYAASANFVPSVVDPGTSLDTRNRGLGVRCLLS